jgi:HK97 family phage major capsid protein
MKQNFLKFPAQPRRYAPQMQSRAMGLRHLVNVAYKSDGKEGGDEGEAEVKAQLGDLGKNVKSILDKSEALETEVKELKAAAVKKDEADKKTTEALNQLIAERKGLPGVGQVEGKSFAERLKEGLDENGDGLAKFVKGETKSFSFEMKAVADMGFSGHFASASQSVGNVRPGIIANPDRALHVRSLVPQGTMDGSAFHYVKENGVGEGAPATAAENATKAQLDFDLVEATANAEYIAGWLRISKKMLGDVKGMTAFLQSRLLERLLVAEDDQLLNGDGTSPNISGITDTGNFTAASGAATVDVEQLVQAISQLEELNRTATGIVLRNSDYWNIALNKASGSGEYNLPKLVTMDENGILRIAGVPVSRTTAMTADKFLVGDLWNSSTKMEPTFARTR